MNKKSSILDYDLVLNKGFNLLKDDKKCVFVFFLIFSVSTGIKISQSLIIKHKDLEADHICIKENSKIRKITLNNIVKKGYLKLTKKLAQTNFDYTKDDFVFLSQKETVYRPQSINLLLKQVFSCYAKTQNISSTSLIKAFGRKIWEEMNRSEQAISLLSKEFSQNSVTMTRSFLEIPKTDSNINLYKILEK
ncbi:MAG: hypothetical protein ACOCWG_00250 [bacterium]